MSILYLPRNVLKKMKLPLLPDDEITPPEFSTSPQPDSVSEVSLIFYQISHSLF